MGSRAGGEKGRSCCRSCPSLDTRRGQMQSLPQFWRDASFVMCPKGHQRFAPGHLQLAHPACCQSCLRRKSTAEGSPSCLSEQGHCVRSKCRAGEGCWSRSHPQWTNSSMLLGILGCLTLFRGAEHACSPAGQQVMEALSFPGSIPLPPFSSRCG